MDFIEGFPWSEKVDSILVVVDQLSKHGHFFPRSFVTDRDRIFLSHLWTELFKSQGTCLRRSTTYHPQTDGQTEIVNKGPETYLHCFCSEKAKQWALWLH